MQNLKEILDKGAKFAYVGGKGGVGKTVVAAAIAYYYADQGQKTLLASLNPVHSLSSLFDQDLSGGQIKKVNGIENLYALEVEIEDAIQRYREMVTRRLREFLKWAEIPINPEPFIEIATTNPAFEESAMFDKMMDVMLEQGKQFDKIIFDTAAVANAVRLIGLSKIYGLWLNRMIESRKSALSLREKLSFRKDKVKEEIKKDPMLLDLIQLSEKFNTARKFIVDPSHTRFFFVTLPLSLPISVVIRFINMVNAFDIPVGGVFVNGIISKSDAEKDASGYLKSKYNEQLHYLNIVHKELGPLVIGYIPQYSNEIVGINMLKKTVEDMLTYTPE
ncbi:MAG: TRC40/GET3/ArsA family transport-energizing ATPase [Thermoprotei archaeon]